MPDARTSATPPTQQQDHSTTNVHEQGVDEPDIVKTDGKRVVSIADGKLRVIDVASRAITGTVDLGERRASQLLVSGDRALVVTDSPVPMLKPSLPPDRPSFAPETATELVLVDLKGLKEISSLKTDGFYLDARQIGGTARVVVRSQPRLPWVYPDQTTNEAGSLRRNKEILQSEPISSWLPRYELTENGAKSSGTLVDCANVSRPTAPSATSMLTVLTFELSGQLGTGQPVSIVADGDTVYGTDRSLYIADDHRLLPELPARPPVQRPITTAIHQFDIGNPGPPKHVASGDVNGTLLNQYSLSEHEGVLRVATTTGTETRCCWRMPADVVPQQDIAPAPSESFVTTLRREGNQLAKVGKVDGLGKGERIYSVRFIGPLGYVVTFQQTDPLYTRRPERSRQPSVTGELKITGYSAYLHPAGDGNADRRRPGGDRAGPDDRHAGVAVRRGQSRVTATTRAVPPAELELRGRVRPARVPVLAAGRHARHPGVGQPNELRGLVTGAARRGQPAARHGQDRRTVQPEQLRRPEAHDRHRRPAVVDLQRGRAGQRAQRPGTAGLAAVQAVARSPLSRRCDNTVPPAIAAGITTSAASGTRHNR